MEASVRILCILEEVTATKSVNAVGKERKDSHFLQEGVEKKNESLSYQLLCITAE